LTTRYPKNDVLSTSPKKIMEQLPETQYFDLELVNGVVMLKPVKVLDTNLDQIRFKIDKLV
jgi:hypothetical protein